MVVTATSCVTTFGTQTFLKTVRVAIAGAAYPLPALAAGAAQPQPVDAAGAAHPQPALAAGAAQPQPVDAAGAAHPQPAGAAGAAQPQPEEAATPYPLATGTSSLTVW